MNPNETILQFFHWYYPADGSLWNKLKEEVSKLQEMGITTVWLPPAYKACDGGVGYGTYDLWDLGEFDQQGNVRTKYGTKDEYVQAIEEVHQHNIKVIVDVVLNHKMGADETEKVWVQDQDPHDRLKKVGEPYEREILSKFTFPGRKGKYSQYIWDYHSFSGVNDKDDLGNNEHFYRIIHDEYGDNWDESVLGGENGNYDYLMGCDIDFRNPFVREELKRWLSWYHDLIKFDGIRIDAIKHMNPNVINELLDHTHHIAGGKSLLNVAEHWTQDVNELLRYKNDISQGRVQLFDVPLHYHFHTASVEGNQYDIRKLFDNTLMQQSPELSISFVENHDTQPLQLLESPVEAWFRPLANAIILLREQGIPCVFYTSLYGAKYKDKGKDGQDHEVELVPVPNLYEMIKVRRYLAYGQQKDYFDHPNTIGWTREGVDEFENSGCAVVLTNGSEGYKDMEVGHRHAGKIFRDATGNRQEEITINEDGWARFTVNGGSVSVWIRK